MSTIYITNGLSQQNGGANLLSINARQYVDQQIQRVATFDTRVALSQWAPFAAKALAGVASSIQDWKISRSLYGNTDAAFHSEKYYGIKNGSILPFKKNGEIVIVVTSDVQAVNFDSRSNRVLVNPNFAELISNGEIYYLRGSNNQIKVSLTLEEVILHEIGHRAEGVDATQAKTKEIFYADGSYNLTSEQLEAYAEFINDKIPRRDHDQLYRDINGVRTNILDGKGNLITGLIRNPVPERIIIDSSGKKYIAYSDGKSVELNPVGGTLGNLAGSTLGSYLSRGDGALVQLAASTALGSIGQAFGETLASLGTGLDLSKSFEGAFQNFNQTLYNGLKSAGIGSLTAFTSMELGNALGIGGFGAELFNTVSSSIQGAVLQNLTSSANAFTNFNLNNVFGASANLGNVIGPAVGSFFGAKLGSLVISPTTAAGAALASLGSAAGAYLIGTAAVQAALGITAVSQLASNFLLPGVGAFVGFVLGALIGKLFGKKKPRIPTASAEIALDLTNTEYRLGAVTAANGGNRDLVTNMATTAVGTLNELINTIVGGAEIKANANATSVAQVYGHNGNQIRAKFANGAWQNFASADQAVEWGVISAIRQTKVKGGDILLKRAIGLSPADTLTAMLGDIQVAADYTIYSLNREVINGMIAADPRSAFSAAWIVTLGRANELGLNRFQVSDFFGGLGGFLDSFGFGAGALPDHAYENIDLYGLGGAVSINARANAPGNLIFSLLPTSTADGRGVTIDSLASIGYRLGGPGNMSSDNDFSNMRDATSSVTLDDTSYIYTQYGQIPTSGGDDIFVGSNYNDALYGRIGWDWLSGEGGNDWIDGGENDDVLLGGDGVDYLIGGSGNDYLAGGDGNDYEQPWIGGPAVGGLHGGDGNDTLVGGTGSDTLFGEAGDDTLIVDQDRGLTWDYLDGGVGSDTASFERFDNGVAIDMRSNIPANGAALGPGQQMTAGQSRYSPDGRFKLAYQVDGNFVLYDAAGAALWNSGTGGTTTGKVVMQPQGNLVIYNAQNQAIWFTSGGGNPGASLYVQNTGRIAVFGSDQPEVWTSDIGVRTANSAQATPTLSSGSYINPGQTLYSPNGQYRIVYQGDGNVVVYSSSNQAIWSTLTAGQSSGHLAMQPDGNLVLYNAANQAIWASGNGGSPGSGMFLQDSGRLSVFGAEPRELWAAGPGGPLGSSTQAYASMAPGTDLQPGQSVRSPDGRTALFYQNDGNLVLYGFTGSALWASGTNGQSAGFVAMQPSGNLVVYNASNQAVWASSSGGDPGAALYVQDSGRLSVIRTSGTEAWAVGTGGGGYTTRTFGDAWVSIENVTGSRFNDVLSGNDAANIIRGLGGNDQLSGQGGDDILEGGLGADVLDGGAGSDTASYQRSGSGVIVDLGTGLALGGDASGDTFSQIENLRGSNFDDELTGTAGNNILTGLRGNDVFRMTAGNDTLDGGDGIDTLDASGATAALVVSNGSTAAVSGMGNVTMTSVERFIGTVFNDSLTGGGADEIFEGGAGNDSYNGAGGSDSYIFGRGDGSDTVTAETSDGSNAIVLKDGLNWRDIAINGAGAQNLTVPIFGSGDQFTVNANFVYDTSSGNYAHNHKIKSIGIGGLSFVDIDNIDWTVSSAQSDAARVDTGKTNYSDVIFAYGGDDNIRVTANITQYENRGNIIYAGDGGDTIFSSAGDDQFIFERGNGFDILTDTGGLDTIIMGPSVAADDVIYEVSGNDLYIGLRDPTNPGLTASQLSDKVKVVDGGVKKIDYNSGVETINTVEYIRVAGQEIDLTKANINWTMQYYYGGTYYPIALDLDGDGIELRSVEGSRIATADANGVVTRLGWLAPDDGFLALDRDGNGTIDRLSEIAFVDDLEGAKTDLEGLAAYDSDANGKFDASDARWSEFRVWQDRNQDGVGTGDELVSLTEAGISFINLKGSATGFSRADGIDNAVIATTEIGWSDPERVGRGYDVALAALQVRTDDGGQEIAQADATARGKGEADPLNASLYGVQTFAEPIGIAKATGSETFNKDAGRLFRIETILDSGAASLEDGVYRADLENIPVTAGRGGSDPYADSDWTQLGTAPLLEDNQELNVVPEEVTLTSEQKALIEGAQARLVAEQQAADAAVASQIELDAQEAARSPQASIVPPSDAEMAAWAQNDSFRSLITETDTETVAAAAAAEDKSTEPTVPSATADTSAPEAGGAKTPSASSDTAIAAVPETDSVTQSDNAVQADSAQPKRSVESAKAETPGIGETTEVADYSVIISTANARLVQALASFGEAPAMMANYQGLNVANDAQASWLSVDALPSVQRMASI